MNVSSYVPNVSYNTFQLRAIWDCYVLHLWNYEPSSWVGRIAALSRVLAILISFPIVVLALLDISSYGIARTLGVIDDVKASTSDRATLHQNVITPSLHIQEPGKPLSDSSYSYSDHRNTEHSLHIQPQQLFNLGVSQPSTFFASEDHNLKLSGVGVFSPATSRAPSPTISRKNLTADTRQEHDRYLKPRFKQNTSGDSE